MEKRHRCKLCHRSFSNGRALGGHMKAHLATIPLPPKTKTKTGNISTSQQQQQQLVVEENKEEEEEEEEEEKAGATCASYSYGLRENPKKSFRLADPDYYLSSTFAAVDVDVDVDVDSELIQNRESENDSNSNSKSKSNPISNVSCSSVSDDARSPEQHVAMSLIMLSRDVWITNQKKSSSSIITTTTTTMSNKKKMKNKKKFINTTSSRKAKNRCEQCSKVFRSYQAMCGHKRISSYNNNDDEKMFQCPYCEKVFGSGQALGGHKRSHQLRLRNNNLLVKRAQAQAQQVVMIDLNLPAPMEMGHIDQADFSSVLSHA